MAGADKSNWELSTAGDVAGALDWVRRRMDVKGKGLVLIAISENAIAVSKNAQLEPDIAARIVWNELDNIQRAFEQLKREKVTRGFARRTQGDAYEG